MDTPGIPATVKPRRHKWLRICLSAVFVLLALAFLVLWVRSNWWVDQAGVHLFDYYARLGSLHGGIFLDIQIENPASISGVIDKSILGFGYSYNSEMTALRFVVPTWFLAFGSIALAYVPWLPWRRFRFSLKTTMIAVTIISALLGLGVWLVRG